MSSSKVKGNGSASSRYSKFDSQSSTSSSTESAVSRSKSSDIVKIKPKNEQNFGAMVRKFMEKRSSSRSKSERAMPLIVPADFIAEDLKKTASARKGSNFAALPRKLFSKASGSAEKGLSSGETKKVKALTDVTAKANTRTLAMILRSERELLSLNKEQETEIAELKSLLEERNREVDKLKDLCLKQREEIKGLKSAILFPDEMNSQLHQLLDKQGSELKQAKQVIPTLQRQITSLTGQLQILSEDLAEVKADKYSTKPCFEANGNSPGTPTYYQEEASNSLDFSSGEIMTPGSPEDMLLKDVNPCLTPYYSKSKSKEFEAMGYDSPMGEDALERNMLACEISSVSGGRKLSRSSDYNRCSRPGSSSSRVVRRSDESRCTYGRQLSHKNI